MTDSDDAPKPRARATNRDPAFEAAFGARIRAVRVAAKMSQGALGDAIGVSFQQMQKYEKGKDRVSVSTLAAIAAALGVHPGSFFTDGMLFSRTGAAPGAPSTVSDLRSAQRIGERIERLGDPNFTRRLMALVDAVAKTRDGELPPGAGGGNETVPHRDDPEIAN